MDIKFVSGGQSGAAQTAAYIAAYVSKGETESLQRAVAEGLASIAMPPQSTELQLLRRIGTTHLAARETSLQVRHCGLCMLGGVEGCRLGVGCQVALVGFVLREQACWRWNVCW